MSAPSREKMLRLLEKMWRSFAEQYSDDDVEAYKDELSLYRSICLLIQAEPKKVSRALIHRAINWTVGSGLRSAADRAEEDIVQVLREARVVVEEKP